MWRLHINKHFETAPPASTAIHGPNKAPLSHKDNTIGKQECMSCEKEGLGGREGDIEVEGGSLRNKSFDADAGQQPFDCLEDYMDCDLQGLFALK